MTLLQWITYSPDNPRRVLVDLRHTVVSSGEPALIQADLDVKGSPLGSPFEPDSLDPVYLATLTVASAPALGRDADPPELEPPSSADVQALQSRHWRQAVKAIQSCDDPALLRSLLPAESRSSVIDAILSRVEELEAGE